MEKVFNRAIEQSPDLQATQKDGFLVYQIPEAHQGQKTIFHSVLTDFDEDAENFDGQITKLYGYIDFDEMDVCTPEDCLMRVPEGGSDSEDMEELDSSKADQPVLKPHLCIGPFHWTVLLHSSSNLPQVLGSQLLDSISIVNDALEDHNPIIGFNSLMAGAMVNKLHVECLLTTAFPDSRPILLESMPIQTLFTNNLKRLDKTEQPSSEVGVKVSSRKECPRFFKIEALPHDLNIEDAQESVTLVAGLLVTQLLYSKLPHNIVFTQNCQKLYVYPRSSKHPELGWLDICGWSRFPGEDMRETHWQETSIGLDQFELLASSLQQAIESQFS